MLNGAGGPLVQIREEHARRASHLARVQCYPECRVKGLVAPMAVPRVWVGQLEPAPGGLLAIACISSIFAATQ